ncbi:MAG: hypothetical protein HQ402_02955 [Parcubacteria group bacterium]|nr:hypothetical protein [Parcubacteria group bacterium]
MSRSHRRGRLTGKGFSEEAWLDNLSDQIESIMGDVDIPTSKKTTQQDPETAVPTKEEKPSNTPKI